jgi:mono/diheme cytochrome c family protein
MSRKKKKPFPIALASLAVGSAAIIAGLGWLATPPAPDVAMSRDKVVTNTSTIADGAPIVSIALPEDFSEGALVGKDAFEANCAACHGINAAGQNGVAPPLVHKIYEPSHHGDRAFYMAASQGVRAHHWRFGNMPAIDRVSQDDVAAITAYIRELQRANGIF